MLNILTYAGFGLILISTLVLIFLSFKQSFLWGLLCFLISPLPFSFVYWGQSKRYLGIMLLGFIMLIPPYNSLMEFNEKYYDSAASAVYSVIEDHDREGGFSKTEIRNSVGGYVKCEGVELTSSFKNIGDKYPVKWTGIADCRFTKKRTNIEVVVKQLESGEWELVDTTIKI